MKIVFMGTPDFSVPSLEAVLAAGHQVGYVVTQPDRAKNRGKKIQVTPVKEAALKHGLTVLQPENIKKDEGVMELLRAYAPDIIIVAAYGQIIQKELLDLPRFGCINVHASLLPKLRGASPIQHAILQGEKETGITIMQMAEGLDTGDMLAKDSLVIGDMNGEELQDALAEMGAALLVKTLPLIEAGAVKPEKQDDSKSTYAGLISKQDGKIDFKESAEEIQRRIRAFDPWPGAFCTYNGAQMKIWQAVPLEEESGCEPGTILRAGEQGIDVACGRGTLRITQLQLPGKKRVEVSAFLRGHQIEKTQKLQ